MECISSILSSILVILVLLTIFFSLLSSLPSFSFPTCNDETPNTLSTPLVKIPYLSDKEIISTFISFLYSDSHRDSVEHLWHTKLGHVPFVKMKDISSIPVQFIHK